MFSGLARALGIVSVKETSQGLIEISGVPADVIARHIGRVYQTKRIAQWMFTRLTKNGFVFPSWFAVEFHYIAKQARLDAKSWGMQRALDRIIEGLEANTWLKGTLGGAKSMVDLTYLRELKWKAKPHQLDFLKAYGDMVPRYNLRGYYLASPPGTGKTFMDLALATCVIPRSLAEVVIVISPKNALDVVWKDTIRELFHHEPKYWTSSQPGPAPVDRKIRYFVFHNEALDRALVLAQQMAQRGIKFFVIIDESHNFNEIKSRRTQMLIKLLSGLRYKPFCIWASGSPIKALGTEAIPFLKSCDPLFTDDAERRFAKIFGGDSKFALELLAHRLGLITFKVSKDVVMSGTKPKTIQKNIQLPKALSDKFLVSTIREEMREYIAERLVYYRSEMEKYQDQFDRVVEYHRERLPNSPDARQKFMRYMRIINQLRELQRLNKRPDPVLLSIAKAYETGVMLPSLPADQRKKFKECQSVVKALKLKVTGEAIGKFLIPRRAECALELGRHGGLPQMIKESLSKTLVFSTSIKAVLGTAEYLKDVEGFEPRVVYQKTNHALPATIKEFRDNPEVNPVVATFQSLSTAVPMTMASTLAMLNLPFRQYLYDQTISRVYRLGQPYPVTIYEIVLDTGDELNVSTRAMDILVWCREHLDVLLGGEFAGPSSDDIIIENVMRTE